MSRCVTCGGPKSKEVCAVYFGAYQKQKRRRGICKSCDNAFCNEHRRCVTNDDDCGTTTFDFFCLECVDKHNQAIEIRANAWKTVPCIGKLVAWCLLTDKK